MLAAPVRVTRGKRASRAADQTLHAPMTSQSRVHEWLDNSMKSLSLEGSTTSGPTEQVNVQVLLHVVAWAECLQSSC